MTSTRRRMWSILLAVIALLIGGAAHGQNLERGQGVMDRPRPDYDAQGIRLGSFLLYPAGDAQITYNDNILASENGRKDDAIFTLAPSVVLDSDWAQHAVSISANSSSALYTSHDDESYTDWGVAGNGRLDFLGSSNITTLVEYQNLTEPRDSIDSFQVLAEPTDYDRFDAGGAVNYRHNRVAASLGGVFTRLDYDDGPRVGGGVVDQDFRDRDILKGVARLAYSFAAGHSAFVRGTVSDRDYRKSAPPGMKRDSIGYEIVAGWASAVSNLVAGEVFVGYLDRNYDGSMLSDVSEFTAGLDLEWYATEAITLKAGVSRDVPDSTTTGVGGILRTAATLGIDYELMPNVLMRGDASYEKNDFRGSPRDDDWFRVSVGVKYLVNRYVHLDLEYGYDDRASNITNLDFRRNRVSFGFRLQR